jgi:hypothetical protein
MYEWSIIGGGIQGVTVAAFLLKQGKTTKEKLRIIDPLTAPLENWKRCTSVISMSHLRSPSVHHLDVDPYSLQYFAKEQMIHRSGNTFYGRYKRPALDFFNEHCDHLLKDIDLAHSFISSSASAISKEGNGWSVSLENGQKIVSEKVVTAIGISEQLHLPPWAKQLKKSAGNAIYHVFDKHMPSTESMISPFIVVGGGITASHLAIKLAKTSASKVTMIKRHGFRVHDFDSDPQWLGPKMRRPFCEIKDYAKRRFAIRKARNKGSIPSDIRNKLSWLVRENRLQILDGIIEDAEHSADCVSLLLADGKRISGKTILLATGFEQSLPGNEWLAPVIKEQNLPCSQCGYPIVNRMLEWAPNLYVSGALAELEVGPIARNISGARIAASIIASTN